MAGYDINADIANRNSIDDLTKQLADINSKLSGMSPSNTAEIANLQNEGKRANNRLVQLYSERKNKGMPEYKSYVKGTGVDVIPKIDTSNTNPSELSTTQATDTQRKQDEVFNDTRRNKAIEWPSNILQGVADNANETRYNKMDPYWNTAHAKNNFRGNVNGKTFTNTLAMSRLADKINNRFHATPTDIGARTNSSFGSSGTGVEGATPKQWNKIETEEMRQMRNNEKLDVNERMLDQQLANKVRGYNYDMQKRADTTVQDLAKAIGVSDIAVDQSLRQAIQQVDYNLPAVTRYQQILQRFGQDLMLHTKNKSLALAIDSIEKAPAFSNMFANVYTNLDQPDYKNMINNQSTANRLQLLKDGKIDYSTFVESQLAMGKLIAAADIAMANGE